MRTRRNDAASHPDLFSFPLTQHKPHNIRTTMKHKDQYMSIIEYEGVDYQIVEMSNASEPGSVGEVEILYTCMDRWGGIKEILDWELEKYREATSV